MPDLLFAGLISLTGLYVALRVTCAIGWHRVVRSSRDVDEPNRLPKVSVLIPARDEADTIEACLTSVLKNEYPANRLEIIVIDDASSDRTAITARRVARRVESAVLAGDPPAAGNDVAVCEHPIVRVIQIDAKNGD